MNGKLIAMLIRSNALMIEALKMADANAQARDGGPYHFETSEFNNLVADCELLAKEAEEYTGDVEIQQAITVAAKEGAERAYGTLNNPLSIMPISPAHAPKREPLLMDAIVPGRRFMGRSEGNGQTYAAVITETDTANGPNGREVHVKTQMLIIDDRPVTPFERPLPWAQLTREFIRWEK